MTGKTHRVGGVVGCLVGYSLLVSKGLLVKEVEPLVQLCIMYPFAIYGSTVQDMDHGWQSVPSRDLVSWCLWRVLHLTTNRRAKLKEKWKKHPKPKNSFGGKVRRFRYWVLGIFDAKHRSWQTHSDLFVLFIMWLLHLTITCLEGTINGLILNMVVIGLLCGVLSHCFLDLLTPDGLHSVVMWFLNKTMSVGDGKLHLVPKSKFFSSVSVDKDGNPKESAWEYCTRKVLWLAGFILLVRVLYILSPYRFELNL